MAIIDCFRKNSFPIPGMGPINFPEGKFVTVLDWSGLTLQTLVFTVTVKPDNAVVKWRRKGPEEPKLKTRGKIKDKPLNEGSFQGKVDFNIYPSDRNLKIELRVDDPNVRINVTYRGAVSLPDARLGKK
jgi:hypothetical protein